MKKFPLLLISLYQKTLSPDHSWLRTFFPYGFCKFYPSCSQYAYCAVSMFGSVRGFWLAFRRLLRCNPFSSGGVDEVPHL